MNGSDFVISLQTLMEQTQVKPGIERATGNIAVIDQLFVEENREALKESFPGVFAFLAFHPSVDKGIVSLIKSGFLSSESGGNILVLFTFDSQAKSAVPITDDSFSRWLSLDTSVNPSYLFIRDLFKDSVALKFPGIVFFEDFIKTQNPVYVSIEEADNDVAVARQLRGIFSFAEKAFQDTRGSRKSFSDAIAENLRSANIGYERGKDVSAKEWFTKVFRSIYDKRGDIVTIVKLFL